MKLSVIVPYVREYPQNIFTVMNLYEELRGRYDFEIIAVNNYVSGEVRTRAGSPPDDEGQAAMDAAAKGHKEIISLKYDGKLSHWQAKNYACAEASGDVFFFCDAHCVVSRDSLHSMLQFYEQEHNRIHGTLHLPLTYKIHEWHKLIYKPVINKSRGEASYTFASAGDPRFGGFLIDPSSASGAYEVPCMSTCGMLMGRKQFEDLGGWPKELGIYSGGEHFSNYASAILGYKKWIFEAPPLRHHGAERGYSFNFADLHRNRMIALYIFAGENWLNAYVEKAKTAPQDIALFRKIASGIKENQACVSHRARILARATTDFETWLMQSKIPMESGE